MKTFFHVEHLSHSYLHGTPLEIPALIDVSLHVARGEVVGLIGPTGSGKSTLLQHLCGLFRPQSGRVIVDGIDLSSPEVDLRTIRTRIGMVFQSPEEQLFEHYVGDDIAFGPRNMGLSRDEIRERVRWAMEAVGLNFEAFKDRMTLTLSGGERRKVALAGVLAMKPQALLLDEPTAGLDPIAREELLTLIQRWVAEHGMTVILSSHNMDDIATLTSRIYVLHQGRVEMSGPTQDVFAQADRLKALGLEPPALTQVLAAIARYGLPVDPRAFTVPEALTQIELMLSRAHEAIRTPARSPG